MSTDNNKKPACDDNELDGFFQLFAKIVLTGMGVLIAIAAVVCAVRGSTDLDWLS